MPSQHMISVFYNFRPVEKWWHGTEERLGLCINAADKLAKRLGVPKYWQDVRFYEISDHYQWTFEYFMVVMLCDKMGPENVAPFTAECYARDRLMTKAGAGTEHFDPELHEGF